MQTNKPDKLDKCYYWHIITLATMKNKLRDIGGIKCQKMKI